VRGDQAIAVILDPTLKVAICVAVVSNWSGEFVQPLRSSGSEVAHDL